MASKPPTNSEFSLIIRGDELPFDEISEALGLAPTRMVRKGELLNRLPRYEAPSDLWTYTLPLTDPEGEDEALNRLLAAMDERKATLESLSGRYQITFRLVVESSSAHISYQLMPATVAKVAALGFPLDVSSLSWGEV